MSTVMGINHATSGSAVWLATTATLPALGTDLFPLAPAGVLAGTLVCAGAALLPDADHRSATIAQSVPVLGRLVARSIEEETGGHRHGAHTLLAALLVTVGAVLLGRVTTVIPVLGLVPLGPAVATIALICFAVKARGLVQRWTTAWLLGAASAVAVLVFAPDTHVWFPLAVGLGFVVHLAGDLLTVGGIPGLLWPIQLRPPRAWRRTPGLRAIWKGNGFVAVPVLGNAGSLREHLLGAALGLYCVYAFGSVALQALRLGLLPH